MKTPITIWIEKNEMSPHLKNSLGLFIRKHSNKYVQDVTEEEFLSVKGSGIKRWEEFEKLRRNDDTY
ncbi:MAG: hypothetical protein QNK23_00950 [Crocinitomicaceae bacterium]|nr:hypothetical protein [Crocinitomicaceae bacterium]